MILNLFCWPRLLLFLLLLHIVITVVVVVAPVVVAFVYFLWRQLFQFGHKTFLFTFVCLNLRNANRDGNKIFPLPLLSLSVSVSETLVCRSCPSSPGNRRNATPQRQPSLYLSSRSPHRPPSGVICSLNRGEPRNMLICCAARDKMLMGRRRCHLTVGERGT